MCHPCALVTSAAQCVQPWCGRSLPCARIFPVKFGVLGAVEVRDVDGASVSVGGPRVRALLALLLLDAGRPVSTHRLIDGLYGADPPDDAANALQSQVSRLRRRLRSAAGPGEDLVEFHPAGYRLVIDPDDVDVHRFERLAHAGRRARVDGNPARAATLLGEALGLWRGPMLADITDAPFADAQRTRLDELWLGAVEEHAEAELALGHHEEPVADLRALVDAHPLRERARGLLMRALYGGGRQAEALAVFDDARRRLAEELGADPSAELADVQLAILRADPALAPPERPDTRESGGTLSPERPDAPVPGGTSPPAQLTSFVGREAEIEQVGALLATARLVTLTGPGGAGKTRLAIEASRGRPGEVCFVDLAPLGSGAHVPHTVLTALGVRETGLRPTDDTGRSPDPTERLVTALTERPMLLIVDNCEHVIDAVAQLVRRLLTACPDLRVLATSREALGITGESLCPLPPLALPPPDTGAADTLTFPAARLFADRAAAGRPDFEITDANVADVLRICRALDGLPLAIELAAARLRTLPVAELAARLDDRFRLLSRGDRTAARRHRTLRAVVEWSWELLDEAEQRLARRLTVFAGGATLDAVARVCGLPDDEASDLLAGLADKSLIEVVDGRYRMLDTIRVFCAERLAEAGEREGLCAAHAAYFLDLAQAAEPQLRRAAQLEWLARLDAEHGNLHAALRWIVRADSRRALLMLAALGSYWLLRGVRSEGAAPAAELLASIGPEPPDGLAEEYALCALIATYNGSRDPDLDRHRARARAIMEGLRRPAKRPIALVLWAMDTGPAGPDTEHLSELFAGDTWLRALGQFGNGYQTMAAGRPADARAQFDSALTGFRSVGERWGISIALDQLAQLADQRGDRDAALMMRDEALGLVGQLGAGEDLADLLSRRADGLLRDGDLTAAHADYRRVAEAARRAGAPEKLTDAYRGLGDLARRRGEPAEARRLYEVALRHCPETGFSADEARFRVLIGQGRLAEDAGDTEDARQTHHRALDYGLRHGHLVLMALAAEALAGVALLESDGERAAELLGAGVALRGEPSGTDPDVARVTAAARRLIGDAAYTAAFERGSHLSRTDALDLLGT